ncbi:hypothetical protein P4482_09070 [Neobacillus thermocopriae]|uniref:hypothetical protein n=1 Tax=Neobacillus thermocopriae TaxID=1215031 RepID=UPI002E23CFCB|nr:hypothetical protein [Neobacillus thermocopriae]MED3714369.1 hypothetical protein [Neobacillus thermocopriae]
MIRNTSYYALNLWNEYLSAYNQKSEYVENVEEPALNQFTYDFTHFCGHINSDGLKARQFEIHIERVRIGDIIEIEADFLNVGGGANGSIVIMDEINSAIFTSYPSDNATNRFKRLRIKHSSNQNTRYKILVGLENGKAGNVKIRNVKVKVHSSMQGSQSRKLVIEGNAGYTEKYKIRKDFAYDDATLDVRTNEIVVTWRYPISSELRPVPSISLDDTGNSKLYIPRISACTQTGFVLRFYDLTGALVPIANMNITSSVFVNVSVTS